VQSLPSSQPIGVPPQIPLLHVSAVVQALESLHASVLGSCRQPLAGSQESVVHGFPSLQPRGVPPQVPPPQVSPVVQALPSSHGALLFAWTHPLAGSHESVVQGLSSSQIGGAPPRQVPLLHVSPVVQALPSLHGALLFAWTHPPAGSQESFVQGLPSSQIGGAPPMQVPPLQVSPVVQAFLSSHAEPSGRGANEQPVSGLQESAVHEFPSSQTLGLPRQFPPLHASSSVQRLPSLQGPGLLERTQAPVAGSQASVVQAFPSSQLIGAAPHRPVAGSQVSWVQGSPSSHRVESPWHTIDPESVATHLSSEVQRFPSSHRDPR